MDANNILREKTMSSRTEVYNQIPNGFAPQVEVAAIYVNVDGKILFLQLANQQHRLHK